ncbi:MAG: phytoene synthase [Bdellovibrionales bacterium CG10_big_fil_rev_8_21_14_0_10_45_34]|nr:MAG: phytoene synthase [Bdellovibrionales bacterium CG10_big_fil_rev_8_21_14_0_10_45_34]
MSGQLKSTIRNGSKSFFLASLFFSNEIRLACWKLYQWCRHCDDKIDKGGTLEDITTLREQTKRGILASEDDEVFRHLGSLVREYKIPEKYPFELLEGLQKDASGERYHTISELEVYSYHVAGVVGLMMSYIMGVKSREASDQAVSMGNAMQLTNIARDVREDYLLGRIYLPLNWLKENGVDTESMLEKKNLPALFEVVERLLAHADGLYQKGYAGLKYLPLRAAFAVSIAGSIYSAIGKKVLRLGPKALEGRVSVGLPEKILWIIHGLLRVVSQMPQRISERFFHVYNS